MGWENGSSGVEPDPVKRGLLMATRLRQALDPKRWNGTTRRSVARVRAAARPEPQLPAARPVVGGVGRRRRAHRRARAGPPVGAAGVDTLRRFNCYSNNDIERVGADLGPVEELASLLRVRSDAPADAIQFETTSGLGTNRATPRLIVRLLREFVTTCARVGVDVESVLPVAGCDPGTVDRFFPSCRWRRSPPRWSARPGR